MHTLVVAEKPSVARDIARVLGAKDRGENSLIGGGYVVTWALGHLVTLKKKPQELDERYTRWRAEDLPILPEKMETKVIKDEKPVSLRQKMDERQGNAGYHLRDGFRARRRADLPLYLRAGGVQKAGEAAVDIFHDGRGHPRRV